MIVRSCENRDVESISDIYNYFVRNSIATFEESPVSRDEMNARVSSRIKDFPWLVCSVDDQVVGYAYAGLWLGRSAYRYSAEVTVYVKAGESRKGYGRSLYTELLQRLAGKYHAIIAGISLPNESSVGLHERLGFEKIAHFREVGRKFDKWIDVGYWQKILSFPEDAR